MRPLQYAINVTLDWCCDHRVGVPNEELHRQANQAGFDLGPVAHLLRD